MVVAVLVLAACAPTGHIAHGRQGSWHQVDVPAFRVEPSHQIEAVAAPADAYRRWTAVGSVSAHGRTGAAAWSSTDGLHWTRTDLEAVGVRASVASDVAARQNRVVVVGAVIRPAGDRDAYVWTSNDGSAWTAVPLDSVVGGPGEQSMTSVAAGPAGFVAAGVERTRERSLPVVWWSPDGDAWSRVSGPFLDEHAISDVAVGTAGVVAVGTIQTGGNVDGMVWFSPNGTTWRPVPLGAAGFTGRGAQTVTAVTATRGGFVAVGDDAEGERRVAVVWTSADGITWNRQLASPDMAEYPTAESTQGVSATSVAGAGPVVAVGGGYSLQVWTSPDGSRWTRGDRPADGRNSHAGALVAAEGATFLVVTGNRLWLRRAAGAWIDAGTDETAFPRPPHTSSLGPMIHTGGQFTAYGTGLGESGLWRSPDGGRWERQPTGTGPLDAGYAAHLIAFGTLLVAVGVDDHPNATDSVAAVWMSADQGTTWERVEESNPAFLVRRTTQMNAATASGAGLVAVGLSYDIRATIDAHAWFSADGRTWRRASDPPAWSGPGDQYFADVCALPGGGVVAVGAVAEQADQDVWAWVSQDGVTWVRATEGATVLGGPGPQFTTDCASSDGGVLVPGQTPGAGGRDGVLWKTVDGLTWTRVGEPGLFSGPGDDVLSAVAVDGDRIVVTGHDDGDLTVFSSGDGGVTWGEHRGAVFGGVGSQGAREVAIAGDRVVLTGYDGASAAVWIGPAPVSRR